MDDISDDDMECVDGRRTSDRDAFVIDLESDTDVDAYCIIVVGPP